VDRVAGNFVLRVVALLCGLCSETSGLFQPTRIGQVAFCSNKEYIIKVHHRNRYADKGAERLLEETRVRHFVICARRLGV